jgi:hypothetical protein
MKNNPINQPTHEYENQRIDNGGIEEAAITAAAQGETIDQEENDEANGISI